VLLSPTISAISKRFFFERLVLRNGQEGNSRLAFTANTSLIRCTRFEASEANFASQRNVRGSSISVASELILTGRGAHTSGSFSSSH